MLVGLLCLSALARSAAGAPAAPGPERAEQDLRASWRETYPETPIVRLQQISPRVRSQGDWAELTYLFDVVVARATGEQAVKVGVNYLSRQSSPYVPSGVYVDEVGSSPEQAARNARPKQAALSKLMLLKLNAMCPSFKWDNFVPNDGQASWNGKEFAVRYSASVDKLDSERRRFACKNFEFDIRKEPWAATWFIEPSFMECPKSATDPTLRRGLACGMTLTETSAPPAASTNPASDKPELSAEVCADPCQLLMRYAYDDLAANACKLCRKHDDTFCETDFPWNDVPACDAYDELRNCIFARFGYVFAKPKWQQAFGKLPWYKPDPSFKEDKLSATVKGNIRKLKELKDKRIGCQ